MSKKIYEIFVTQMYAFFEFLYSYPPFEPYLIYVNLGVLVLCGVCMSFNMQRKNAALVHCGQLLFLTVAVYSSKKLKYSDSLLVRAFYLPIFYV